MRKKIKFSIQELKQWITEAGFKCEGSEATYFNVYNPDYPKATIYISYSDEGVTTSSDYRKIRSKKTILQRISNELNGRIRRYKEIASEEINKKRIQDAFTPFNITFNYTTTVTANSRMASARIKLENIEYFADGYDYGYNEAIKITLFTDIDREPVIEVVTENMNVFSKIPEFVEILKDTWLAAGI